ncbi:MAG: molecular chaperone DnaJ [bacterium]
MQARQKDYYGILGIPKDADLEMLKRAYRRLAKKFHPDHRPEDALAEERFKEVLEAYEVLKDPRKRIRYDAAFFGAGRSSNGDAAWGGEQPASEESARRGADFVGDVFEHLRRRMESRGRRGGDLRYHLSLSLEEAALGLSRVIHVPRWKSCPSCLGRGWVIEGNSPVCGICRGEGEVAVGIGGAKAVRSCPGCGGKGILEKTSCGRCKGKGSTLYRLRRKVTIPPGVDNGTRLKIRGYGEQGEKGEHGDLYIVIQIEDHPIFTRQGLDVWCEVPIHFTQAALGARIEVPTLQGVGSLQIPAGTQSGSVFRMEGRGFPGLNGSRVGDQNIRVTVEVPRRVSREERKILRAWQRLRKG